MRITHFTVVTVLVLWSQNLVAQDTIVKKDDALITAKILEVHEDEIHYKKFNNLEGPTYVIETAKITSIIYQNGEVETYDVKPAIASSPSGWQKQSEQTYTEAIEIYNGKYYYHNRRVGIGKIKKLIFEQGDPVAIQMWNTSKTVQRVAYGVGFGAIPVGVVSAIAVGSIEPALIYVVLLVEVPIMIAANITLLATYKNKRIKAVELYNVGLKQETHEEGDYY